MKLDSKYLVNNQKKIIHHFTILYANKCVVSAKPNPGDESIITAIIQINENDKVLVLDYGLNEFQNKQLIKAPAPIFEAEFEGIKLVFTGKNVKKTRMDGQIVFSLSIPDSIYWIQRRACYRVKIPLSHRSYCKIRYIDAENEIHFVRFKLLDISASGMAFHDDHMAFANDLIAAQEFIHCRLFLDEQVIDNISFDIVNQFNLVNNKPNSGKRVGCKFKNLTPSIESHVSRYMQEIEREQRNLGQ